MRKTESFCMHLRMVVKKIECYFRKLILSRKGKSFKCTQDLMQQPSCGGQNLMQMLRPRAVDRQASSSPASAGARATFIHQYSNERRIKITTRALFSVCIYTSRRAVSRVTTEQRRSGRKILPHPHLKYLIYTSTELKKYKIKSLVTIIFHGELFFCTEF
jgi:hypothetical protein